MPGNGDFINNPSFLVADMIPTLSRRWRRAKSGFRTPAGLARAAALTVSFLKPRAPRSPPPLSPRSLRMTRRLPLFSALLVLLGLSAAPPRAQDKPQPTRLELTAKDIDESLGVEWYGLY